MPDSVLVEKLLGPLSENIELKILRELADEGPEFDSLDELKSALLEKVKKYPKAFPAGDPTALCGDVWSPIDILIWGARNGYLIFENNKPRIIIKEEA